MERYERPAILATYSVDELVEEAATCEVYYTDTNTPSDRDLKEQIEGIEGALERVTSIGRP
jgi:hypothetical protein